MRKNVFVLILALIIISSGCVAKQVGNETKNEDAAVNSQEKIDETVVDTSETDEQVTPTITPIACKLIPNTYSSEQEFVYAVKNNPEPKSDMEYSLEGIDFYFVPETVPKEVHLDHIAVKDFYITFMYKYDEEDDPHWERTFIFTWYRTKGNGEGSQNTQSNEKPIYHIREVEPVGRYDGNNEYVCQEVDWEQNGYVFHAIVPIWFTKADVEKYCDAKMVVVE